MNFLKSTNYWMSLVSLLAVWILSSRLEETACVLMGAICASYCIGRGFIELGKGGTKPGWTSPEFQVTILSLGLLAELSSENFGMAAVAMVVCVVSYNIGRGLARHYRSKISTVFNR